jgi:hypothetical protein
MGSKDHLDHWLLHHGKEIASQKFLGYSSSQLAGNQLHHHRRPSRQIPNSDAFQPSRRNRASNLHLHH